MSELSTSEQKKEDWMNAKWRPMMGWMYMLVCTMDFVVFPVLWSLIQSISHGNVATQWSPVTLQGAGLFHMAMGAVIGVAAFGRTQEKLAGKANDNAATPSFGAPTPSFGSTPVATPAPAPVQSSFGGGFNSTPANTSAPAVSKFGKVVPQDDQPVL
jgi:hypothetical protein